MAKTAKPYFPTILEADNSDAREWLLLVKHFLACHSQPAFSLCPHFTSLPPWRPYLQIWSHLGVRAAIHESEEGEWDPVSPQQYLIFPHFPQKLVSVVPVLTSECQKHWEIVQGKKKNFQVTFYTILSLCDAIPRPSELGKVVF